MDDRSGGASALLGMGGFVVLSPTEDDQELWGAGVQWHTRPAARIRGRHPRLVAYGRDMGSDIDHVVNGPPATRQKNSRLSRNARLYDSMGVIW